jgi:hypothetical protein
MPPVRTHGRSTTSYVVAEEVGENTIITSAGQKYNLRPRE